MASSDKAYVRWRSEQLVFVFNWAAVKKYMTLGIDKLTDEELLKVVIAISEMLNTSIAEICIKLEKQDIERLVRTIKKHKELWR